MAEDDDINWTMPFKKVYHQCLCRLMEFQYGFATDFNAESVFTRDELLAIRPSDIQRFFGMMAYNDPDYDIHAGHRPTFCRSTTLEAAKKALSYYMPHRTVPWCNGQGNPTRSGPVNDIIKEVKKFEVRGEGCPSKAKRAVRPNEFRKALHLLRGQPGFDCKYKYPMICLWQHALIGRLDDAAHFEVSDPAAHPTIDGAIKTKVRWSKNVMEERQCPPQILFGSLDSECCVMLNLAVYLEEFLRLYPNAKYLFTDSDDDAAPTRLKQNHRNNMDRHVFKNDEFMDLALESDQHQGLGTHSFRKGAADEARKLGALVNEIEIRGRWKSQGRRVVFRYIDVTQNHIDAKVAALLCPGGAIKYKLKASLTDQITDDWLFTCCVPNIRRRFPNDRRLCRILGLATLFAGCDPSLRDSLPEFQKRRLEVGLQTVEYETNCVERVPLHIYSVNGNLVVNEIQVVGVVDGVGAPPAVPLAGGTGDRQILQSILLQQARTTSTQALMQVQIDNGFAMMKTFMQRQHATMNDNIRRFGGTIQGAFARQDPVQASGRHAARSKPAIDPNVPAGTAYRDPTAELCPNLHTLEEIWTEWKFGIGGRKAAQHFTTRERGGHGHAGKKMKFCRRLKIYLLLQKLVDEGRTPAEAVHAIKLAYGHPLSVTALSDRIRLLPDHPNIVPARARGAPAPERRVAPARGCGRGGRNGGRVQALPTVRRLAPIFRGANVPRFNDGPAGGAALLQGMLDNTTQVRAEMGLAPIEVPPVEENLGHHQIGGI